MACRQRRPCKPCAIVKVTSAIESCRTAALGGHVARCEDCAHTIIAYNSCQHLHRWRCHRPSVSLGDNVDPIEEPGRPLLYALLMLSPSTDGRSAISRSYSA
jgi:Transposase zinc-binding domain